MIGVLSSDRSELSPLFSEPLPDGNVTVGEALRFLPLASVDDLASVTGFSVAKVWRVLNGYRSRGLVDSATVGWSQRRLQRHWLTPAAFAGGIDTHAYPHLPGGREHLLDRLPLAESFYRIVADAQEQLGPFVDFSWYDGVSFDAVATFRHGWFCLYWAGLCQSGGYLRSRLDTFRADLRRLSFSQQGSARPVCLLFVVSDYWQAQVVQRVVGAMGLSGLSRFVFLPESLSWGQPLEPGASVGSLVHEARYREPQDADWSRFVDSHFASSGLPADVSSFVLDFMVQWPEVQVRQLLRAFRASRGRRRVCMDSFLHGPLVSAGDAVVSLSRRGVHHLRRRDAVPDSFKASTLAPPVSPRLAAHERGLRFLVSGFAAQYCETAVGTRSYESLPGAGISPDALVYFSESPFGAGWHYVEYERRVQGPARAAAKLKGYLVKSAATRYPLLMVCRDLETEAVFNQLAYEAEPGFQLAVTTLSEAAKLQADGMPGLWRVRGVPVSFK